MLTEVSLALSVNSVLIWSTVVFISQTGFVSNVYFENMPFDSYFYCSLLVTFIMTIKISQGFSLLLPTIGIGTATL